MSESFDRWLERSLRHQLAPAYSVPAIAASAQYRRRLVSVPPRRGLSGLRSLTAGNLALLLAVLLVLGTVGAEASGNGPIKLGHHGIYVQIGTPATPNPPVASPISGPSTEVATPRARVAPTPGARESEDSGVRPGIQPSARPSESPERETEGSSSPQPLTGAYPTGSPEPGDH